MFEDMKGMFMTAAKALNEGIKDTGMTNNGLRKLDFHIGPRTFTVMEQNPEKTSPGAILARKGDDVVFLREIVETDHGPQSVAIGTIDLTQGRFNSFGTTSAPLDIAEIEAAVNAAQAAAAGK